MAKNSSNDTRLDYDNWFDALTDQYDVPAAERGAMQEVLKRINRNMRKPTAIPLNQFAACLVADKRSAKKWLDGFVKKGWLKVNAEGEYTVNLNIERSGKNESAGNNEPVQRDAGQDIGFADKSQSDPLPSRKRRVITLAV